MKIESQETVYLSGHWLSPLINGDMTGLEDFEEPLLNDFAEKYAGWTFDVDYDSYKFTRDAISSLMVDCYKVMIVKFIKG